MSDPIKEASIDPVMEHLINNMDQLSLVQYSTQDQLTYLHQIAVKMASL